jgi:hypothetical protein
MEEAFQLGVGMDVPRKSGKSTVYPHHKICRFPTIKFVTMQIRTHFSGLEKWTRQRDREMMQAVSLEARNSTILHKRQRPPRFRSAHFHPPLF